MNREILVFIRSWIIVCPAVAAACGGGSALSAQQQAAIGQMERALDAIRLAEQRYYATNGVYTTDPSQLAIGDLPGQAELVLEYATTASYFAWATHPDTEWTCFIAQPASRPYYTRCLPPEDAATVQADTVQLDPVRPAG